MRAAGDMDRNDQRRPGGKLAGGLAKQSVI
jgi:hypothetical protein